MRGPPVQHRSQKRSDRADRQVASALVGSGRHVGGPPDRLPGHRRIGRVLYFALIRQGGGHRRNSDRSVAEVEMKLLAAGVGTPVFLAALW